MKHSCHHSAPLYPNAAQKGYFAGKILDILTAAAACVGFVTALICLLLFL